jgi:hypothetical protein
MSALSPSPCWGPFPPPREAGRVRRNRDMAGDGGRVRADCTVLILETGGIARASPSGFAPRAVSSTLDPSDARRRRHRRRESIRRPGADAGREPRGLRPAERSAPARQSGGRGPRAGRGARRRAHARARPRRGRAGEGFGRRRQQASADGLRAVGRPAASSDRSPRPEATEPSSADARSDVYSAGATLFTLVTGKAPVGLTELELGDGVLAAIPLRSPR